VDTAGNVVMIGSLEGYVDFGGGLLMTAGGQTNTSSDVYVVKLSPTGAHVWSRRFGNASDQDGRAGATDGMNNIFVGGEFYGTLAFGNTPISSSSGDDAFLAKLPP